MIKHSHSLWILTCVFMALVIGCGPSLNEQMEKMLQEMATLEQGGKYDEVEKHAVQAGKFIEQHPKELADKKDRVSLYKDKAQLEKILKRMETSYQGGNYDEVLQLANQADKLIEKHPKELADKKDRVSSYRDKAQTAKDPSKQIEENFQEMETLYQRGRYDAMLELVKHKFLFIARNPELEKEEYRVWYYKAKAHLGKARLSKSANDFQEAYNAITKSIELARALAEARKLNEEQRKELFRPLVQVYMDTVMVGVDILTDTINPDILINPINLKIAEVKDALERINYALKLIQELREISEEFEMYPEDMTPAYKLAELLYYITQGKLIKFNDEEAKPDPDIELMNMLVREFTEFVGAANEVFNWATEKDPKYSDASILCIRLHFFWSDPEYYFEDCKDPLKISSTQAVPQITAPQLIENRGQLLFKAIIYLDASDAQVLSKSNFGTLLQTERGKFYLRGVETDAPVKLIGRFTDVLSFQIGGVVVQVPELKVLAIKKG